MLLNCCTLQDFIKISFHKCLKAFVGFYSNKVNIPELSWVLSAFKVAGRECCSGMFGREGAGRVRLPLEWCGEPAAVRRPPWRRCGCKYPAPVTELRCPHDRTPSPWPPLPEWRELRYYQTRQIAFHLDSKRWSTVISLDGSNTLLLVDSRLAGWAPLRSCRRSQRGFAGVLKWAAWDTAPRCQRSSVRWRAGAAGHPARQSGTAPQHLPPTGEHKLSFLSTFQISSVI